MTDIEKAREMPSEKSMEKAREIVSRMMFSDVYEVGPNREPVNIRDKHAEEIAGALDEMQAEIDRLRHDIERHVNIAAAEAQRADSAIAETREEMAKILDDGYPAVPHPTDPVICAHGRYGHEDCDQCAASAIRATGKESER